MALAGLLVLLDDVASMMGKVAVTATDDIATATKMASAGIDDAMSMAQMGVQKASMVVVDDIPVNAKAVAENQIDPRRELAVVAQIARGSLINKAWIVPVAVAVNSFAPSLLIPILMLGGAYLAYEGAEKVIHAVASRLDAAPETAEDEEFAAHTVSPQDFEKNLIRGAIRTDIVMSTEITFIALGAFYADAFWGLQLFSLAIVGILTTVAIYGFVGGLVKLDDIGLHFFRKVGDRSVHRVQRQVGKAILVAAPKLMRALSVIGTVAMLYIGGQLIGHGIAPIEHIYHLAEGALGGGIVGGAIKILAETVVGIVCGSVLAALHIGGAALTQRFLPDRKSRPAA